MSEFVDHYAVLGVQPDATAKKIKARYRELARTWHPDLHTLRDREDAEARFKEIAAAYEILVDPDARAQYDTYYNAVHFYQPLELVASRSEIDFGQIEESATRVEWLEVINLGGTGKPGAAVDFRVEELVDVFTIDLWPASESDPFPVQVQISVNGRSLSAGRSYSSKLVFEWEENRTYVDLTVSVKEPDRFSEAAFPSFVDSLSAAFVPSVAVPSSRVSRQSIVESWLLAVMSCAPLLIVCAALLFGSMDSSRFPVAPWLATGSTLVYLIASKLALSDEETGCASLVIIGLCIVPSVVIVGLLYYLTPQFDTPLTTIAYCLMLISSGAFAIALRDKTVGQSTAIALLLGGAILHAIGENVPGSELGAFASLLPATLFAELLFSGDDNVFDTDNTLEKIVLTVFLFVMMAAIAIPVGIVVGSIAAVIQAYLDRSSALALVKSISVSVGMGIAISITAIFITRWLGLAASRDSSHISNRVARWSLSVLYLVACLAGASSVFLGAELLTTGWQIR
jgi:curved DNA-binding protein CbpA